MSEPGQGEDRRSWWEEPDEAAQPGGSDAPSGRDAETTAVPSDSGDPYRQEPTRSIPQTPPPASGAWSSPQEQPQPPQWGGQNPQGADGYPPVPQDGQPLNGYGRQEQHQPQHGQPPYGQARYGQPQYAPGEYGQGQYAQGPGQAWGGPAGYPQQAPVAGAAHAVLWTAVGGLVLSGTGLGWIAAVVALALTPGARRTVLESGGAQRGLGHLFAGKVVAWVTIGLTVLAVVGIALLVGIGLSGQGSYDDYDFNTVSALVPVPGA